MSNCLNRHLLLFYFNSTWAIYSYNFFTIIPTKISIYNSS